MPSCHPGLPSLYSRIFEPAFYSSILHSSIPLLIYPPSLLTASLLGCPISLSTDPPTCIILHSPAYVDNPNARSETRTSVFVPSHTHTHPYPRPGYGHLPTSALDLHAPHRRVLYTLIPPPSSPAIAEDDANYTGLVATLPVPAQYLSIITPSARASPFLCPLLSPPVISDADPPQCRGSSELILVLSINFCPALGGA
ncbi:hypothetical protein SISSUDRAFT_1064748 [Sistotremastrum suecicum HHB10207 ss-3]|uniref:Uncharacterized protein n=1 Tax=Sistotremastrum suecicum HHB10207 ss-3 TaxID=1314776 RepID=A0A166A9H4_9AGAM|nr:hypothetical protein SISSUDRAFT_1064748 [Sistotremastrum suecicum HHB10207 ss-3]